VPVLSILAYLAFGLAALLVFFGLTDGGSLFVTAGISSAIAGVLFLAVERIISLLTDIRDRLPRHDAFSTSEARPSALGEAVPNGQEPTVSRSPELLDADLARVKDRLSRTA
jgi:hypothetical protein